jgi:ring-1,2-phenylacetyl-CoA epoxidase subunit PaaA
MFTDRVERDDVDKLPAEYREVLVHQLAANGEGELSAGDTYLESFLPMAPDADERYTCARFGAEEIDHYRRFARLLAELGLDVSHMLRQSRSERRFFPAESMNVRFDTWEERAAFSFLCELEGHYQIKEMVGSTYGPLAEVAPVILKEEAGHFGHGVTLMRRAAQDDAARARAQAALERFYPMALDMFGRSESRRAEAAVRWGLRKHTNGELRALYARDIAQHITRLGYRVPEDDPSRRRFA